VSIPRNFTDHLDAKHLRVGELRSGAALAQSLRPILKPVVGQAED
jgi:hypothetical protein